MNLPDAHGVSTKKKGSGCGRLGMDMNAEFFEALDLIEAPNLAA